MYGSGLPVCRPTVLDISRLQCQWSNSMFVWCVAVVYLAQVSSVRHSKASVSVEWLHVCVTCGSDLSCAGQQCETFQGLTISEPIPCLSDTWQWFTYVQVSFIKAWMSVNQDLLVVFVWCLAVIYLCVSALFNYDSMFAWCMAVGYLCTGQKCDMFKVLVSVNYDSTFTWFWQWFTCVQVSCARLFKVSVDHEPMFTWCMAGVYLCTDQLCKTF